MINIIIKNELLTKVQLNHWYTFKNADVKYICDINVLGKANDEAFLIVQRGETTILNQKLYLLLRSLYPKKNVSYFLESFYSEKDNLSYFYDKYLFTLLKT